MNDALKETTSKFNKEEILQESIPFTGLPLKLDTLEQEITVLSLLSLLDNWAQENRQDFEKLEKVIIIYTFFDLQDTKRSC